MKKRVRAYMRNGRNRRFWKRLLSVLSCVVVFVTTYALLLPAVTLEKTAACGMEAHQHDQSCFEQHLICGLEETDGHQHTDDCYTVNRVLACTIEEHSHTEECFNEEGELTCALAEHSHEDGCWREDRVLSCKKEETEPHHHTDTCYESVLVCQKPVHIHSPECYVERSLNLAQYLTGDTTIYVRAGNMEDGANGVADETAAGNGYADGGNAANGENYDGFGSGWLRVDGTAEITAIDLVRLHYAYTIPAGTLTEGNQTLRYALPDNIRLTDDQIREVNAMNDGRGAQAVEGIRTPDQQQTGDEYISAWILFENVYKDSDKKHTDPIGQNLVLTFDAATIEKNRKVFGKDGALVDPGQEVSGFFSIDVNTDQISFDRASDNDREKETQVTLVEEDRDLGIAPIRRTIRVIEVEEDQAEAVPEILNEEAGAEEEFMAAEEDAVVEESAVPGEDEAVEENAVLEQDAVGEEDATAEENAVSEEDSIEEEAPAEEVVNGEEVPGEEVEEEGQEQNTQNQNDQLEDEKSAGEDEEDVSEETDSEGKADSADADSDKDNEEETKEKERTTVYQGVADTLTFEGADYTVTASYTEEAGIPEGASLVVSEITEDDDSQAYENYRGQAEEAVAQEPGKKVSWIRLFDITVEKNGKPIEPQAPVSVQITYHEAIEQAADTTVDTVHFEGKKETPRVLETAAEGTDTATEQVSFETDGFSVFAVVGTVIETSVLASDGHNYKVTVTYGEEAKLPDDVELKVEELAENTADYSRYLYESAVRLGRETADIGYARIFDISLVSRNDPETHYQPEAGVSVSIELVDANENMMKDLTVLHISDGQVGIMDSQPEGNALSFQTDSFSIYPILDGSGGNARIGYRFWYFNAATGTYEQISSQYFRYKDVHQETPAEIYEPGIPGISQSDFVRIFKGWHKGTVNDDTADLQDQGMTIAELNNELQSYQQDDFVEGTIIDVIAELKDSYYVTYVDVNSRNILATDLIVKEESGDSYFTVKDGVKPTKYENKLTGWRLLEEIEDPNAQLYAVNQSYPINKNITLAPVIDGGYWLIYDDNDLVDDGTGNMVSGGASYTAPEFYMNSIDEQQTTQRPADPVWPGYEFAGWYEDEACTTPFEFGGLLANNKTVYAKWIPSDSAYRVIVWKQKSTDAVGLDDSEKKYDYDFSVLIDSGVKTGDLVYLDNNYTTIYGADGSSQDTDKEYFEFNPNKTNPYIIVKADGSSVMNVYYDRVPMSINFYTWGNGYVYTETTSNDGTQYGIVNGEYVELTYIDSDEDIYTYTYSPVYGQTTGDTGTQYGVIDGAYQQLTREAVYSYTYNEYNPTTSTNGTQYALIDGEYVQLTRDIIDSETTYRAQFQYTPSNANRSGSYYIPENGTMNYRYLYRNNNRWYRTRTGSFLFGYEYSDEYVGNVYTGNNVNLNYTGQRYILSGTTFIETEGSSGTLYGLNGNSIYQLTPSTTNTYGYFLDGELYEGTRYLRTNTTVSYNGTRYNRTGSSIPYTYMETNAQSTGLYGIDSRGGHVALNRSSSTNAYRYTFNGEEYTGTRYTANNNPATYTGQLYRNDDGIYHATDENANNGLYGIDANNVFRPLYGTSVKAQLWSYTDPVTGETKYYEGTRYTRSNNQQNSWQLYKSFDGLYGSTLESNKYTWPTDYNWYDTGHGLGGNANATNTYPAGTARGSRMTLKTTFEPLDGQTATNFYGGPASTVGNVITFYKQKLDGSYEEADSFFTGSTGTGTFHINDKYTGFHAAQYSTGTNGSWISVTPKGADGYYGGSISYSNAFKVRFDRDVYKLTFFTNNDGNEVEEYTIPFEGDLSAYAGQSEGQKTGNYFVGWFADAAFADPFDFNTVMPDHNVDVYGKWLMERFRVVIVPGASNVDMGSQAHTFRLDYDEKIGGSLLESATRVGYTLDGWYTDPEFTNKFLFSSPLNANTEGVDMTYHTASKWASARADYGDDDEDHANVRGIIHLYAKWILDTSEKGINIVYDAGEAGISDESGTVTTEVPIDPRLYQEGSDVIAGASPTNYSELYEFLYWVAVDDEGNEIKSPLYAGATFNLNDINKYYSVTTDPDSGEELIKTVMLRAKYRRLDDTEGRFTTITYDGNSFEDGRYPNGTEEIHGLSSDGSLRKTVTLDKEINETIVLPDTDSFYLDGFTLVGWSFFEGTYEQQIAALEEYNAKPENADNQLTNFEPNQEVAADNLDQGPVNDRGNTLYAMWQPKTYTVTVRQVVEDGVSQTSFTYPYKSGVESEITAAASSNLTLNGDDSVQYTNLTMGTDTPFQYYDRLGHVFHITAPSIPATADYDVRVSATVLRDDGSRETLDVTELGNYPILGDVEITYTYALKVPVTLEKRELNGNQSLLTGAKFVLTPVEFNTETQRWEQIGTSVFEYDMIQSGSMTQRLQEGIYRVEEETAPENYARMSENLLLTVKQDGAFVLRSTTGGTISTSIAILTGGDHRTLTVYDRPIKTVTLKKLVDGTDLESNGYVFDVSLTLDGSPLMSYDTVGDNVREDITNNAGIIQFRLKNQETKTLQIPWGTEISVTEKEYDQYDVSVTSHENVIDLSTDNEREYRAVIEQDDTITFTNTVKAVAIKLQKVSVNNMDPDQVEVPLAGARFTIYTTENGYTVAVDAAGNRLENLVSGSVSGEDGLFFDGLLSPGTYYLQEMDVPDGHNAPAGRFELVVTAPDIQPTIKGTWVSGNPTGEQGTVTGSTEAGYKVTVRNVTGVSLPSTGGPGTRLIYLLGTILIMLAATGLVMRKKRRA